MTPPVRPEFDPAQLDAAVRALKAQGAPDEAIHAYLRDTVGLKPVSQGHDYHAEYASGALEKRMQGANARDVANAAENTEVVGPGAAFGHALGATMANAGEGIPGFEAAQAGLRSVVRQQPYREALGDLRHETDKIPAVLKAGERIVGAAPLSKFMPGSPLLGGALIGGADQALSADPDQSLGGRAVHTALGAAGGALVGKTGELAVTGARTLFSKTAAANVIERLAKRAASAQQLYSAALREGKGKLGTVAIKRFLNEPDIAEIVSELKTSRPFQGVADEAPEMLDAVYKTLSDRAAQLKKGLESIAPNRPNIGRFRMADTKAAQTDLIDAVSGGVSAPGPMPTYRAAVTDFATRSKGVEGVKKGYDAIRTSTSKNLPRSANLTRTTPESLQEWAKAADDASKEAAGEGVLGGVKMAVGTGLRAGFKALRKAPSVMRDAGVPGQDVSDQILRLALLAGIAGKP